jgi:NADPH-dependent curcumin reductase CurA
MAEAVRKTMKEQARRSTRLHSARDASPAGQQAAPEHLGGPTAMPSAARAGEILVRVQGCGMDPATDIEPMPAEAAPQPHGIDAAGSVIATGAGVTRFAVGDDVFGHFPAGSWAWVQAPCARLIADGPHVERRPEGLSPLAAAALARSGLVAKTILRAAEPRAGQTAVVIGPSSGPGVLLLSLLRETGARVIAGATSGDDEEIARSLGAAETIECSTADPVGEALAHHPDVDLLVDLVSFGAPYFITAGAPSGTIVVDVPDAEADEAHPHAPGAPRVRIAAEPGDLAALARRAVEAHQPIDIAGVYRLEEAGHALPGIHGRKGPRALAAGA